MPGKRRCRFADFKDIKLNCEPCRVNKFKRVSFKSLNEIRSKKPLELLYADIIIFEVLVKQERKMPHRSKLDARAQKGYLLGYAFKTRGYRVWLPEKNKVIETKNVPFDENKFYGESSGAVMGTNPYNTTEIIIPSSNSSYSEDIVRETSPVSDDSLLHTTDDKDPECDIKGAYLYASLDKEVYMTQPPGFVKKGEESKVCRLDRAIYGLHQSVREWFFEMHRVLTGIGFTKIEGCDCAYMFKSDAVLILYVDNFVLFSRTSGVSKMVIDILSTHVDVKILGNTRKLLGVEFEQYKRNVFIHAESYISEAAERYIQYKFPITSLPITKGSVYSKSQCPKSEEESREMSQLPYRNILGCLSFIASRTRPDISYAINIFSQFQSNPVYSDADFASNRDDRTSVGGQLVMLDNSPIEWRTFKQKCVTLSTMESEFVAMTDATRELIWFDRILIECFERNVILEKPVQSTLFVDNMATIDFVKSSIENCRSKHIDVKLFFVRD
ncbi:Retrovirus-related Pol polyprotein from transposon TNT 1-94 [Araneus ventricosus]|uniref:Retrovirus-related Pol polyprotein from transposon TNT 1-94 n=1 Tax=Araneus ventricosus TaxID=182803 RepID=A0A4Y2LWL6_ARAVE|nr:Retrovirus-related Pol polyprotein from transposon TNT 1-94 [Araneus ventricosus]